LLIDYIEKNLSADEIKQMVTSFEDAKAKKEDSSYQGPQNSPE
jgi:hypothetical protein